MNKQLFAKLAVIAAMGVCTAAANAAVTFTVAMTINKTCSVAAGSATSIQLGAAGGVASTATNTTGSGSVIAVTCSHNTPYNINLTPGNGNVAGLGAMVGTGTNTDKVPYQLSSTAGPSGTVWGNGATDGTVANTGNGLAGTGTGLSQAITVYATAASANFQPDSYTDTVTVAILY